MDKLKNVKFCKRCCYSSDHPLGIIIDEHGICSGCRIHEEKDTLDWDFRWEKLKKLVKPYKTKKKFTYDCIIPVSGSHDSYYIVYIVKFKLGLNPLLVTYNKYYNTPLGIKNLANLRIKFNCDIIYQNINPLSVKKITRTTLRSFGSVYWHVLAGQTVFPVQTSVRYKIPLIIWGAHQGLEQVGMFSHEHEVEMTRRYRKDHDLMGYEADDLLSAFDVLKEEDIWQYRYPDDLHLSQIGVRGIYLGNYVRWDPKAQHEAMIKMFGFQTSKFNRTFDTYDYVDCFNYMNLHDQLKLYKHGYSKVTDHASREIRFRRLNKATAIKIIINHEQKTPMFVDMFCDWLGISKTGLNFLMDYHKNLKFWTKKDQIKWKFKSLSSIIKKEILSENVSSNLKKIEFVENNNLLDGKEKKYITIGKGYE